MPWPADQSRATVQAALNFTALQPGQQAVIAVVLDIAPGYHAQSHTPLDPNLIAFEVKLEPNDHIQVYSPLYPPGQVHEYPALGKVSVYDGRTITYIPIQVKSDAPAGKLTLSGKATYQICDDQACYPPEDAPFAIQTEIVPPGQPLHANQPELFAGFDPTTFVRSVPQQPQEPTGRLFGLELRSDAYLLAFAAALVVGVIFNVMPCVLPIVPLKAMGFYQAAQQNRARSLALGAVFSLGIVATFGVLAIFVVVLRIFAWGELFGNPYFAGFIVMLLLVMAMGTFGLFSILLPTKVYMIEASHETFLGNFLFGILTAVLSTPCTFGMFLVLLVWAANQPPVIGTALVMTVGLGMALPYLILAAFPQLARRIPRSGPWAEIVKQMMAFLLLASAVYFGRRFLPEPLRQQGFWWVLFAVIAAAGLFLIIRTIQLMPRALPIAISFAIATLLVAPALAVTLRLTNVPVNWVKYTPDALQQAMDSRQPVLIKFTADWCGNCQAIEATVYTDNRTVEALRRYRVIALKADLTNRGAPGWQLLRSLHPVGAIPFTAIYLPGQAQPHKLAGIYTTDELLSVLEQWNQGSASADDPSSVSSTPRTADASPAPAETAPAR